MTPVEQPAAHKAQAAPPPAETFNPPTKKQYPVGPFSSSAAATVLTPAMMMLNVFAAKRYKEETQKTNAAITEVRGQNATWNAVAKQVQQYEIEHPGADMSANSPDPEVQALRHAVQSAWNDRVNAYAKYTMPDVAAAQAEAETDPKAAHKLQQKHKKSVLDAVKAWVHGEISPETPQLILQSQLNQMRAVKDPMQLIPPPAPKDVLNYSQDQDKWKQEQIRQQLSDLYATAPGGDVNKMSPANQSRVKQLQNQLSVLSTGKPVEKTSAELKADAMQAIQDDMKAGKKITPDQWRAAGVNPPAPGKPVTVTGGDGTFLIPIGENGQPQIGKDGKAIRYQVALPKDTAAQDAAAKAAAEYAATIHEYMDSHPNATPQEAKKAAWAVMSKDKGGLVTQQAKNSAISNAIAGAMGSLQYNGVLYNNAWQNFAYIGGDGLYHLRSATGTENVTGPLEPRDATGVGPMGSNNKPLYQSGDKVYAGNLDGNNMSTMEGEWRNALRTRLKQDGFTAADIDQVLGPVLYLPRSASGKKAMAPVKSGASGPPPSGASAISDSQVAAFMASPGGKGMSKAQARAALEAAANGGQ